jgi:cysteine desulfurase
MNSKKNIYLDYAATTPVAEKVEKAMQPYFTEKFGNTASLHSFGRQAKLALENSRQIISGQLNANPEELIFTSSATESNNLALKGLAWSNPDKKHLLVSAIEHDCVLNSARWLKSQGFLLELIPVNKYGLVDPKQVAKMIKPETLVVSVMHANNEIGTIEPIEEIGSICREKGVIFHTDAAQTFGKIPLNVSEMPLDMVTISSHKMYGPKGAAGLYIKGGIKLTPLLHGGGHESGLRSSTVNVAAVVGFAQAVKLVSESEKDRERIQQLRDKLISGVLDNIPDSRLNGHPDRRLYNNTNFSFSYVEGESIVLKLDQKGVAASTGSACSAPDLKPSHVLLAIGIKPELAHGSLRLTLGRYNTEEDIVEGVTKNY